MKPQDIGGKTFIEHAVDSILLCGELCNMLALFVAFIVFYLVSFPFTED